MTDTSTPADQKPDSEAPKPKQGVSGNPALVEWPSDPWGNMTPLRSALLEAARTVRGDAQKLDILMGTLTTGILHAKTRFKDDVIAVEKAVTDEQEAIERRLGNTRVHGHG